MPKDLLSFEPLRLIFIYVLANLVFMKADTSQIQTLMTNITARTTKIKCPAMRDIKPTC